MKKVKFVDSEGNICKGTLVYLKEEAVLIKFTIQNSQEHYGILYNDIVILLENGETIPKDKVKILELINEWFPALEAFVEENFNYLKD